MIKKIDKYLNKYDKIVLYYDNGQEVLGKILDQAFTKFSFLALSQAYIPPI